MRFPIKLHELIIKTILKCCSLMLSPTTTFFGVLLTRLGLNKQFKIKSTLEAAKQIATVMKNMSRAQKWT
jgi:hypothetical protein